MKKLTYLIISFMILCLIPNLVLAKGNVSVSLADLNIGKGKTATFTITANNSAGKIDILSNNEEIASVSESAVFLDMESCKITVTGKSIGKTKIKIFVADATTYDDEDLTGNTYTINVNVVELSSNNNIKDINVDGHKLIKVDNNNYTLSVNNSITDINITALAEDPKATVKGDGLHKLNIGDNNIEITVISESGLQNKINVLVTRKDASYIEDLTNLLNIKDEKEYDIIIEDNTIIKKEEIINIKESEKIVRFNYYNNDKKLIYSWEMDGKKIDIEDDFLTSISYENEYVNEISEITNSAKGKYIDFKYTGNLPEGLKVKLYVGDSFIDENLLKVYHYNKNNNELELIKDNLTVKTGYVEFENEDINDCFITTFVPEKKFLISDNILIIILVIIVLIIVISFVIIKIFISKKGQSKNINYETINTNADISVSTNYNQVNNLDDTSTTINSIENDNMNDN